MNKTLVVLLGPTGIGKTLTSIRLAQSFDTSIISADSRQVFREMKIGTAAPDEEQLNLVPHYFIGNKSIFERYSSGQYELDVIDLLQELHKKKDVVLLVGGSMLYIDAVCKGIDDLPTIDEEVRSDLLRLYEEKGLEFLRSQLRLLDPEYYKQVDLKNAKRILHALEICYMTQKTYSSLRTNPQKKRSFNIIKVGLNCAREELYQKINTRVDAMIQMGLLDEAKSLYQHKDLNALNTVGYKELFKYFSGEWNYEFAVDMIKQNTRRYAKKQLSWFLKDENIKWFHPNDFDLIQSYINEQIKNV